MAFSRFRLFYFILSLILVIFSSFACKTKKVPMVTLRERTFVIQVCDKFQMSYDGLPCNVYFSDGTSTFYTTAIDGRIIVKISNPLISIEKDILFFRRCSSKRSSFFCKL